MWLIKARLLHDTPFQAGPNPYLEEPGHYSVSSNAEVYKHPTSTSTSPWPTATKFPHLMWYCEVRQSLWNVTDRAYASAWPHLFKKMCTSGWHSEVGRSGSERIPAEIGGVRFVGKKAERLRLLHWWRSELKGTERGKAYESGGLVHIQRTPV